MQFNYLQRQDPYGQLHFPQDDKSYKILSLSNTIHIAKDLGKLVEYQNKQYVSGEYITVINEPIDGEIIVMGNIMPRNIMEFLSMIDASRRAGAAEITLIIPYFSYARQDKMESPYSSVGFEILARIINTLKVKKVITIDIHNSQMLDLFDCETVNISSSVILSFASKASGPQEGGNALESAPNLQSQGPDGRPPLPSYGRFPQDDDLIITPDIGAYNRIDNPNIICINKIRQDGRLEFFLNEPVEGSRCFIMDDILDTGSTIKGAIDFLYQNKAREVRGFVTHILGNNIPKEVILTTDSLGNKADIETIKLGKILRQFLQ